VCSYSLGISLIKLRIVDPSEAVPAIKGISCQGEMRLLDLSKNKTRYSGVPSVENDFFFCIILKESLRDQHWDRTGHRLRTYDIERCSSRYI
jgi:hypothetical protein